MQFKPYKNMQLNEVAVANEQKETRLTQTVLHTVDKVFSSFSVSYFTIYKTIEPKIFCKIIADLVGLDLFFRYAECEF